MKENMTLNKFVQTHSDQRIEIMSPGGYVTICPERPLTQLFAHAGVRGTEIPIPWEELKGQIVQNCNFNQSDETWFLLTVEPSLDCPIQAPEMQM